MPETNGIDLAVSLKAYEIKPYLIFVSTVESLVYQTFKVNPFWFIRKRFCESELPEVITALLADMRIHLLETITLNCAHSIYTLHPLSICYVECQKQNPAHSLRKSGTEYFHSLYAFFLGKGAFALWFS